MVAASRLCVLEVDGGLNTGPAFLLTSPPLSPLSTLPLAVTDSRSSAIRATFPIGGGGGPARPANRWTIPVGGRERGEIMSSWEEASSRFIFDG